MDTVDIVKLKTTKSGVRTLVDERRLSMDSKTMFITISPNPKTKVKCTVKDPKTMKYKDKSVYYGMMPQRLQYEYCLRVIKEDYFDFFHTGFKLVGSVELNSSGNVHIHMLVDDPRIRTNTDLQIFRRDILNCPKTQANIEKGKVNPKDWMNNIVFLTKSKEDIISYMEKDQSEILVHFDNIYV